MPPVDYTFLKLLILISVIVIIILALIIYLYKKYKKKVESGEKIVVGANRFTIPPEEDFIPKVYQPDQRDVEQYTAEYRDFKQKRDDNKLKSVLEELRSAVENTNDNLVPYVFAALEASATFAEIIGVLRMADGLEYDWAGERQYPF